MNDWPRHILGMIFSLLLTSCHTPLQNTPTTSPTQVATEQPTVEAAPTYALHQPSMEEYLSAIPDIITRIENQHSEEQDIYKLEKVIFDELWLLYGDQLATASYGQLTQVAPYLLPQTRPGPYAWGDYEKWVDTDWHAMVVNAWLRDNQPDLESNSQWTFDHYTLNLEVVDFNGDGIDKFSVELVYQTGEYEDYREYFIWQ